ncbi:MAG: hypothetical protein HC902_01635 [Calothrix sp. SM1_5_4]|nr:hypothetical protein [Calothrix sp. SM1_5_4]
MFAKFALTLILAGISALGALVHAEDKAYVAETDALKACLRKWSKHPFDPKDLKYRTISPKVKVLGVGGDVNDNTPTESRNWFW